MYTNKRYEKKDIVVKGSISSMLKKARTVLSTKQYRELCSSVNEANCYNEKKGLIIAFLKSNIKN